MPGRTGKRARPAGKCITCGGKISGAFLRSPKGDQHIECDLAIKMKARIQALKALLGTEVN